MKIAILGNGRSRDLYKPDGYNVVLGCNMPSEEHKVDYSVLVDAKAVCLAFRRTGGKAYKKLVNKDYKLVLGPRAAHGSTKTKADPASSDSVYQDLLENEFIYKEIPLWPDAKDIGQRYFSAGHLAFAFANMEWKNANIHMFGFDSFFTGYQASYTDSLRGQAVTQLKRKRNDTYNKDNPVNTVGEWYAVWEKILNSNRCTYKSITIHGFEGDEIGDFFKKHIQIKHYPKDKANRHEELFPTK